MKTVKVYGVLRERLGQSRFDFDVVTPAQAIKALCANFSGLDKWFIDSQLDGIAYKVTVGERSIAETNVKDLTLPWSENEVFKIIPVVSGSGGLGRVLFGAVLIGTAFLTAGASVTAAGGLFTSAGWKAAAWTTKALTTVGGMMVLSGVSQMLTPVPPALRDPNKNESYGFGGVNNNVAQGSPVPICYGRLFIGSSPISVNLDTDEVVSA